MRTRQKWKPSTETIAPISWELGMASPPHARRELAHEMAGLVTSIFNSSIKLGEAPSDWRIANALPIFKSGGRRGKKSKAGRNRTVSLTSIACHFGTDLEGKRGK